MSENKLIQKAYYETFLSENQIAHPIRVLGEAYMLEQQNEIPDLSYIRFAQGEVYFHHKDYESAIFKWENIQNELEPWARKNMADAFFELELFQNAEEMYKSIITDSVTLNTEIGMQLFSLYMKLQNVDSAFNVIKKVVSLNPDYPHVTEIAREFFEEQQDWVSAAELVTSEAIRTEYLHWFDFLKGYVENGYTKMIEPSFFIEILKVLYDVDQKRFENMIIVLANSYKKEESYFIWIKTMNDLFIQLDDEGQFSSLKVSSLFKDTYIDLMNGKYSIHRLHEVIPKLLTNWIKISDTSLAPAAVLAWNELFPESLTAFAVNEAEQRLQHSNRHPINIKDIIGLFDSIVKWASELEVGFGDRLEWLIGELMDLRKHHLLIAEMSGSGKSAFINFILGDNIARAQTSTAVMYQYQRDLEITEITDSEMRELEGLDEFHSRSTINRKSNDGRSVIDFRCPCPFLYNQKLAIIDTPGFSGNPFNRAEVMHYLNAADSMLFLLNGNAPFGEKEKEVLLTIREQMPNLSIHFILKIETGQSGYKIVEKTKQNIQLFFPKAEVISFSVDANPKEQEQILSQFMNDYIKPPVENDRVEKLLHFLRKAITDLLQKRVEVEKQLNASIEWTEEMLSKLNGAIHQLKDLEDEKIQFLKRSFNERIEVIQNEMEENIPKLLKGCSDMLTEDSNFGKIHQELNNEMNIRIQDYLEDKVLETLNILFQEWICFSKEELEKSQLVLDERSEGFNVLLGEEKINLLCDFKVIEDWHRDIDRMTSGISYEKVNFFNKFNPTQFLLKSAGKLLSSIGQNKSILYNKYKSYVETENYQEVTKLIMTKFLQQFHLFDKGLERDLKMFFKSPFRVMNDAVIDVQQIKQSNEESLTKLKENPEMFHDPLTLFELRLRQYEWIIVTQTKPSFIN